MAQVMVNFRIDEDVKKNMEQACREMGLTMTTAFTIFATKVGKEKRIPFEITADPHASEPYQRQRRRAEPEQAHSEEKLARKQEQLETLGTGIRRSLTAIHTAIPSSITGLSVERIRLLCGDELKDKAAGLSNTSRTLFSGRNAELLEQKDLGVLDEYMDGLSSIGAELLDIEHTLVPAMKAWRGEDAGSFDSYQQRLAAVSRKFDELACVIQRFWRSTARSGGARAVSARIRQAAAGVETAYVLTALENLEALILRHYDSLDGQAKTRLEADYLPTLELTLRELGQTERDGGDIGPKAALCLRAVNVLSQVISDGGRTRRELDQRSLEGEGDVLPPCAGTWGAESSRIPEENSKPSGCTAVPACLI